MRLSISKGFIMDELPLHVLNEICNQFREFSNDFTRRKVKNFLENVANEQSGLSVDEANKVAREKLEKRLEKIEFSHVFDPFLDTSIKLCFYTVRRDNKNFFVGFCVTHQMKLWEQWLSQMGVKEFCFDNSGDMSDDYTEEEWKMRNEIWSGIVDNNQNHFSVEIVSKKDISII